VELLADDVEPGLPERTFVRKHRPNLAAPRQGRGTWLESANPWRPRRILLEKDTPMPHEPHRTHGNPADLTTYLARLESSDRAEWQMPDKVVAALGLRPGHIVADMGTGPGYFALRLGRKVGKRGRVFAVDIEPAILAVLRDRIASARSTQVTPVLGLPNDPLLPAASCDRVLSVTAYHHLPDGPAALRGMAKLLKRGGRLAVIDFHKRECPVGPPVSECVSREDFLRDMARAGLGVAKELTFLPYQYFFLLKKG
jgi:ubiquinone/menaquinone biosynthesis C-methylase UbiE